MVKTLSLKNFTVFKNVEISFSPKINIVISNSTDKVSNLSYHGAFKKKFVTRTRFGHTPRHYSPTFFNLSNSNN